VKQRALLTPKQAVEFLKRGGVFMTEGALATRRNEQRLPKYTKIGGRIFYSQQELVKARCAAPTADCLRFYGRMMRTAD
jgi:hypothetical protein